MKKYPLGEKRIDSQPSWVVRSETVELAVTRLGAHMAPVNFCLTGPSPVQPYHITPWQNENLPGLAAVETPTRGDFFCMPFGGNREPYRGETHPPHGETAGNEWTLDKYAREGTNTTLQLRLRTKARPGIVKRSFIVTDGHNAVYCRTAIRGFKGRSPFAHHAILRTTGADGTLRISTSRFDLGRTPPAPTANPAAGEYQFLARGASFRSLSRVPSIFRNEPPCDCSAFPVRAGFGDLLEQFERPSAAKPAPSWVAAVNVEEGWMWFALKDPAMMPGRLFWIENQSRHGAPWNGRNRCLGIEDGCMYFDRGIAESCRPNPVSRRGIPTSFNFPGNREVEFRYIQGAVHVPRGFDRIDKVRFISGAALFYSHGRRLTVPVNHEFLFTGLL